MDISEARLRVLAKKFAKMVPQGMAIKLPDDIINQVPLGQERRFLELLETVCRLRQVSSFWEHQD